MEFKITNKVENPKYFNSFVVELKAMFGDDDGQGFVEVGGFKKDEDEELLKDFIRTCGRVEYSEQHSISDVDGFDRWFNPDKYLGIQDDEVLNKRKHLVKRWLTDPTNYEYAVLYRYTVFYYDEHGVKHNVEVNKDGLEDDVYSLLGEYEGMKPSEMTAEDGECLLEELRDIFKGR